MDISPLIFDVETVGLENVADYLDPIPDAVPDDSPVLAAKNLTDPVKIAADLAKRQAAREDENREAQEKVERQRQSRLEKAALDFNCARIVAMGMWSERVGLLTVPCRNEGEEAQALLGFWQMARNRMLVGFRIREFDLPMMIQRSRYLGVLHPEPDLGRYARNNGITDLYDRLTFNDMRAETVMWRSLKSFARRYGLPVTDDINGSEIPALVAAGDWAAVLKHVTSDVELTRDLAIRLGAVVREPANVGVL